MIALSQSRLLRLFTFGALYVAQGVPWGFIAGGYQFILADHGFSNEATGKMMFYAYLPWSFKILWGLFIDRFPSARLGRRRPHIVAAELLMGATMLMLLFFNPKTDLSAITVILFLHNTFAAFQDVAVDALAVDILKPEERGRANGIMWAAKLAGAAAGNGGGIALSKHFGWSPLFVAMALLIWTIMLLPLFTRERPAGESVELSRTRLNWRELRRSFTFAEPLVGIAVAFLAPLGFALVGSFTTRMYRADLKLTEAQFGTLNGWVALVAGMTGALFGGALADRFGVRRTIGATMTAIAINMAVFGAVPHLWPSFGFLVAWYFAQSFCIAAYSAAKFKFAMTLCNPAIGATHFSIYMATTNLCYAFSSRPGGWMADHLGYSMTFYIAALIQVITIGILFFCDPRKAEARFRSTESTGSPHEAPQPAG